MNTPRPLATPPSQGGMPEPECYEDFDDEDGGGDDDPADGDWIWTACQSHQAPAP